jgi:Na+-translocating ferredoxin:NAD+ oxidoreductase RnfG subunit
VRSNRPAWLLPLALVAPGSEAHATVYLSIEQAQAAIFPGATFSPRPVTLAPAQIREIQKRSGQRVLSPRLLAWRASTGGWFIVDRVIGKHEFITYAVGIDDSAAVKGIEVLEYRESYGGEVRGAAWRRQFVGKRLNAQLKLGADIRNISGATLSSKHIAGGVRRLLATHAVVLAPAA